MQRRSLLVCGLVFLGLLVAIPATAATWHVTGSNTLPTPTETYTVEGETFTLSSINKASGGSLAVSVTTTSEDRYQINLYDNDKNVVQFRNARGSADVSFDTSGLEPGTYVVGAIQDGPQAVHPVVVPGASVDARAPSRVGPNEPIEVEATVGGGSVSISSVEAVVWNGDERKRSATTSTGGGTYTASIGGLPPGTYRVSVGVRGQERIEGERQLVGVSGGGTVTVQEDPTTTTPTPTPTTTSPTPTPTTTTPTTTPTTPTTTSPASTTSTTTTPTATPTVTTMPTPTPPSTTSPPHTTSTSASTVTSTATPPTSPPTTTSPGGASPSTDGPITPNPDASTTTAGDGPGFGLVVGLLALASAAVLSLRRDD
jgi:uncharacterized protein (DUF2141 family)